MNSEENSMTAEPEDPCCTPPVATSQDRPRALASEPTLLRVEDLACGYHGNAVVGPMSFHLHEKTFMLIEGCNGVGKSTLIKTLIGLIDPVAGSYDWKIDRPALRFVPQTRTLDPMLPATVFDVLATGLHQGGGLRSMRIKVDRDKLRKVLATVRMDGFGHHLFRELSEGQKQLILLARALLGEPKILLLDEPAASMDPDHEAKTMDLLDEIKQRTGLTIVMIAHGSPAARNISNRIMTISRAGEIEIEECLETCSDSDDSRQNSSPTRN